MLLTAMIIKLVAEIALMAMFGRWVLGLLTGPARQANLFWRVLDGAVAPFEQLVSRIGPAGLPPPSRARWAALGLLGLWLLATAVKIQQCLPLGAAACR